MTRYVLDGRALQDASSVRGIGTYVRGLLDGFNSLGVSAEVELLLERGATRPPHVPPAVSIRARRLLRVNRHVRPLVDPLQVRVALGGRRPALYHAVEYAQPLLPHVPVVATVHDLIPFVMPDLYPWMRRERSLAMRQLRRADAVIAVSRSTARDLQRVAGVDAVAITVIREGVSPRTALAAPDLVRLRARLRLPARFVLAVGTFDPRKRIDVVADVVRRLRTRHGVGLVIAGFQGSFTETVRRSLERAGISDHTRVLGHVSDDDLTGLYQLTECLVFCSAYEGFGLPPLEAMSCGTPVAVFDNSSLPEVVGDAGLVVADGDAAAMAATVGRLIDDPDERQRRGRAGRERASTFTWRGAAAATLNVYNSVLERQ